MQKRDHLGPNNSLWSGEKILRHYLEVYRFDELIIRAQDLYAPLPDFVGLYEF